MPKRVYVHQDLIILSAFYLFASFIYTFRNSEIISPHSLKHDPIYIMEQEAAHYLRLPVWSRGYASCKSQKSEINCKQLFLAYLTILRWERAADIKGIPGHQNKVLHIDPRCGLGNAMYHIISGVMFAVAFNKSIFIDNYLGGIDFKSTMNFNFTNKNLIGCHNHTHQELRAFEYWGGDNSTVVADKKMHLFVTYCYPYFLLLDKRISDFIYSNFGLHFVYFLSNYAAAISQKIHENVVTLFKSIPETVKVIGVHIRQHSSSTIVYLKGKEILDIAIIPFLKEKMENKNYVALATDSSDFVTHLREKTYPNQIVVADVSRKPDGDKESAATDIELLTMCNQMIGTFRSSFSSISSQRGMIRPYYVYMEGPYMFRFSSSQMGVTSMIYENIMIRDFNYQTNFRLKINTKNEGEAKRFFRNEVL